MDHGGVEYVEELELVRISFDKVRGIKPHVLCSYLYCREALDSLESATEPNGGLQVEWAQ
jgi:hypothetical protein